MEENKRLIIVKEIEHWRKSRLLPEQYCDFLMNLYQADAESKNAGNNSARATNLFGHWKNWLLICLIFTTLFVIVFNFKLFPLQLQIGVSVLFILICYFLGFANQDRNKTVSYIFLGIGSIFLLFIGEYLLKLYKVEDLFWILGYFVACSVIWILLGFVFQMGLFQLCGWVGLILFYGWMLHNKFDEIQWLPIQLYWIPITIMFVWLAWLFQHRKKVMGKVYFIMGITLWFVPDIYFIVMTEDSLYRMQLFFVGKLILAAIMIYTLRKKWTEWVT